MPTQRDLVEAHSFSRRRLVTAFVAGAPGGREVEPARPGRTIVGGVVLGVLLMAGAFVTGALAGRTEAALVVDISPAHLTAWSVGDDARALAAQPLPGTTSRSTAQPCRRVASSRTT